MQLTINHETNYVYSEPVSYALQKVRLRPYASVMQSVTNWSVDIVGGKIEAGYTDHFGNHVDLVSVDPGAESVVIRASGVVETHNDTGVLGKVYGAAPLWLFAQPTALTTAGPMLTEMAKAANIGGDTLGDLHRLSAIILEAAPYTIGATSAVTTAEEALGGRSGVCQDHAQIFIAIARLCGIPARYVSGYLMMDDRTDQDATHAWAEAHVDGLGWVGFDVSNAMSPDQRYVRIAIGRDAQDASPIKGMRMGDASESLIVSLQVQQ